MKEEIFITIQIFISILVIIVSSMIIFKALYDRYPLSLSKKMDTTYDVCDYVNRDYERNISGMVNVLEDCFYAGAVGELCEAIG